VASQEVQNSHPLYCVHGVDVASQEVRKVQDITSFLFFCVQDDHVASQELQRMQDITIACKKTTWTSQEVQKVPRYHILSFA
jgi:hypothetical protein